MTHKISKSKQRKKLSKIDLLIQKQAIEMKKKKLTKGAKEFQRYFETWEKHIKKSA